MRILLVRTSSLGDVVHALPVLAALRRARPEAEIGWVVESAFAALLERHRDIDRVLQVRTRAWRREPASGTTLAGVRRAATELSGFGADVTLELMGNHKGGVLAWLSRAPVRIGARRSDRREPSSRIWINRPVVVQGRHAVDRNLSLLAGLGIEPGPADFAADRLVSSTPVELQRASGIDDTGFALIHPGAGWGNKRWPPERWGRLAAALRSRGVRVRVGYGPGEAGLAGAVALASGGTAEPVDLDSLPLLIATLRRAAVVLAGDTGPLHLAHALGVPVVAVLGPTDPERHGPYGAPEQAVHRRLPCSFCYRRFDETKACLWEVTPEMVLERVTAVIGSAKGA